MPTDKPRRHPDSQGVRFWLENYLIAAILLGVPLVIAFALIEFIRFVF